MLPQYTEWVHARNDGKFNLTQTSMQLISLQKPLKCHMVYLNMKKRNFQMPQHYNKKKIYNNNKQHN